MRLHTAGTATGVHRPIVARLSTEALPKSDRPNVALLASDLTRQSEMDFRGYAAVLTKAAFTSNGIRIAPLVHSIREVDHFQNGHILAIEESGFIRTIYRPDSQHNWLFITERCNSNCLMCSQPPKDRDDSAGLTDRNLRLIDLINPAPEFLGMTGGEPTLLGDLLFQIVCKLRDRLPNTAVHMLTNGRRFAWKEFTAEFAAIGHPRLSLGIPLYSDDASIHDYVVQAKGAFDQTVLGLHELERYGISTEVRVVLHALTIPRLAHLAEYIRSNLTFVDHVALMGLEHIGYAPRNMAELWIDPVDYQPQLKESVEILERAGIETRIYNHQLCVLDRSLWKYAQKSISDWKNAYEETCDDCAVRNECGGFFQWATKRRSRGIHAIRLPERKAVAGQSS